MRIFAGLPKIDSRTFCEIMNGYYTIHNDMSSTHVIFDEKRLRRRQHVEGKVRIGGESSDGPLSESQLAFLSARTGAMPPKAASFSRVMNMPALGMAPGGYRQGSISPCRFTAYYRSWMMMQKKGPWSPRGLDTAPGAMLLLRSLSVSPQ